MYKARILESAWKCDHPADVPTRKVVLCHINRETMAIKEFSTHLQVNVNDYEAPVYMYGHYFFNLIEAIADFEKRRV